VPWLSPGVHAEGPDPRRFVDLTAAAILIQTCWRRQLVCPPIFGSI
jgi:hypothetical protein